MTRLSRNKSIIVSIFAVLAAGVCAGAQPRYFGYYDCDAECMDKTHGFANIAMVRAHLGSDPNLVVDQIKHAKSLGMKVILSYFPAYLQDPWEQNPPGKQQEWWNWVKAIKPYRESIVAISPYDEPYLAAIMKVGRMRDVSIERQRELVHLTKSKLETAAARIKFSFPEIPLMYNEAFVMVNDELELPDGYDWVGFDCYKGFDDCQGKSIPEYYKILAKRATKGQKFIAVLPGFVKLRPGESVPEGEASRLHEQLEKYVRFVRMDSRFVAVLVWSYDVYPENDGTEDRGLKGLDSKLADEYRQTGTEIIGRK